MDKASGKKMARTKGRKRTGSRGAWRRLATRAKPGCFILEASELSVGLSGDELRVTPSQRDMIPDIYFSVSIRVVFCDLLTEHTIKKKKRRRRRRRTPKEEEGRVALVSPAAGCGEPFTPARGPPTPVLRPVGAQVPRAPENSTQFIMDDHENSALFLNFDKSTPGWEHDPPASGGEDDLGSATPTHAHARDWYPFNLADFESAYRSAREDRLMGGSRTDLCAAIVALEARAAVLTEALSASPSRLVATLQAQLLTLQEENAALRQRLARRRKQVVPRESSSSSTDSDSESDSTNSSSDCSESDCDTCAARRSRSEREEEKENTRPAVISPPTTP
ncbi:uncharacterized protein LOC119588239 [Penaeus monodon]|uniref:uncharacterized protein LOC119588239 n=1 Tax=Penaeus monodon TaxID=6687 RepID=UPI0018A6E874|nr:uncharacterized protein LOC119588239 [Penaeus monodon]